MKIFPTCCRLTAFTKVAIQNLDLTVVKRPSLVPGQPKRTVVPYFQGMILPDLAWTAANKLQHGVADEFFQF